MADGGEEVEGARGSGTPSTKEAVKSLTTQVLLLSSLGYLFFYNACWHGLALSLPSLLHSLNQW